MGRNLTLCEKKILKKIRNYTTKLGEKEIRTTYCGNCYFSGTFERSRVRINIVSALLN